jgi:hypothetical protein
MPALMRFTISSRSYSARWQVCQHQPACRGCRIDRIAGVIGRYQDASIVEWRSRARVIL